MNNPKITVLIPVYNAEKFLNEAIDSILNQTFGDFEFIIINDASTDNSKEIILSYKDQRIRYLENIKNLGVAKTLNKGLGLAKGKYIARMDADDISYPNRLEMEYKEITKDRMVAVVASFYDVIDESGKYLYTVKGASSAEEVYYALQFRNCLGHSTVMFNKRIILNEFNGYNERRDAEDYDLWLRVSKKFKIIKVNRVLHRLRISNYSRVGQLKDKINDDARLIAQQNIQKTIKGEANPKTMRGLVRINSAILKNSPTFLNRSRVEKECIKEKIFVFVYSLFHSKVRPLFIPLFIVYLFGKRCFQKLTQIIYF